MWHVFSLYLFYYTKSIFCSISVYIKYILILTFYHVRLNHNNTFHLCLWQVERNVICLKQKLCLCFQTSFCIGNDCWKILRLSNNKNFWFLLIKSTFTIKLFTALNTVIVRVFELFYKILWQNIFQIFFLLFNLYSLE